MERETIYLDNDEEITSVVDKLKKTNYSAVDLVIPKEALILQSVVNLKLLKKQAENLGKEVTIVTQDKVGRKLAEQIGLPVVGRPGEAPKEVHISALGKKESTKNMINQTSAKMIDEVVGSNEEEDLGEKIEFKGEERGLLEKTEEVVGEKEKAKNNLEKETVSAVQSRSTSKKKIFKRALLGIGFISLAILVLGFIYLPMVRIKLSLAAEKKSVDFIFSADKSYKEVDLKNQVIPAQEITAEQEKSYKYPATGKKKTGTKASGTVTLYNNFSTTPKTLDAGTKIVASNGLVFVINSNVTVPGYTDPGGGKIPGKLEGVGVMAADIGEQYNAPKDAAFSVPAIGSSTFYAIASANFTGGTSRDIQYVSQADINSAKEDVQKQAEQDLLKVVIEKSDRNQRIVDRAFKIDVISAEAVPPVNSEASEFDLKVKARIVALAFTEDDLTKLAENILKDEIGSTKEVVEKSSLTVAAEFVEGDFDKGVIKIRVSGEAFIATKIDEQKVKVDISNEPNETAINYLKSIDGVKEAVIEKQFPEFYHRIPRINSNIVLIKEIVKD